MPESNTKPAVAPPSKPLPRVTWWLRETIAVVVWGFAVIKLFVYDLDRYLVDAYAPGLRPVLDFRLFILLGLITSLWLILGNSRFRAFVAYVLLYPLVILL